MSVVDNNDDGDDDNDDDDYDDDDDDGGDVCQSWRYDVDSGHLINAWSKNCATHVTDPDTSVNDSRQIIMAQSCTTSDSKQSHFRRWTFMGV